MVENKIDADNLSEIDLKNVRMVNSELENFPFAEIKIDDLKQEDVTAKEINLGKDDKYLVKKCLTLKEINDGVEKTNKEFKKPTLKEILSFNLFKTKSSLSALLQAKENAPFYDHYSSGDDSWFAKSIYINYIKYCHFSHLKIYDNSILYLFFKYRLILKSNYHISLKEKSLNNLSVELLNKFEYGFDKIKEEVNKSGFLSIPYKGIENLPLIEKETVILYLFDRENLFEFLDTWKNKMSNDIKNKNYKSFYIHCKKVLMLDDGQSNVFGYSYLWKK